MEQLTKGPVTRGLEFRQSLNHHVTMSKAVRSKSLRKLLILRMRLREAFLDIKG